MLHRALQDDPLSRRLRMSYPSELSRETFVDITTPRGTLYPLDINRDSEHALSPNVSARE